MKTLSIVGPTLSKQNTNDPEDSPSEFGANSRVMRIGTQCAKVYDLSDFTDAFARFLNPRK